MKYRERLKLAAKALAREVAQRRKKRGHEPIHLAIYEARFSAVTEARRRWNGWLRAHPFSTPEQRKCSLSALLVAGIAAAAVAAGANAYVNGGHTVAVERVAVDVSEKKQAEVFARVRQLLPPERLAELAGGAAAEMRTDASAAF